jgi:hypothetical protein
VGDTFDNAEGRSIYVLKVPVTLLKEPKIGAEEIKIPAGLKYLGAYMDTEDPFPIWHKDIDEVDWAIIVNANTKKVLGWIPASDWLNITS